MKEERWWSDTKGYKRRPDLDEPEILHTCNGYSFPQFCGFEDEKGETHLISRCIAITIGLIGLKDCPDWQMTWDEYGQMMERRRNK